MTTGDERLDRVSARIDEAKQEAARVEDADDLGLPGAVGSGSGIDDDTFEPAGDDLHAGQNPVEGRDASTPGEAR